MEKRLIDLVVKSRNSLHLGEELCYSGTELIQSSQDLFQNLQLLYPRLIFIQRFLTQQLKYLENVLLLSETKLTSLNQFIQIKERDIGNILANLDVLKEKLKNTPIYNQEDFKFKENNDNSETETNTKVKNLFDYIDDNAPKELEHNLNLEINQLKSYQQQLEELLLGLKQGYQQLNITLYEEHASISLTESAIKYAQDKSAFQGKQASIMAQALLTISNHYDSVTDCIRGVETDNIQYQPMDETKLFILERDTEELSSLKEELESSLQVIESVHEDAIVRQQLYHVVYQEKVQFFKQLNMYNGPISELCQLLRRINDEMENKPRIEGYLEDLWSLGTSYEDFIEAYSNVLLELERRQKIEEQHSLMISQFNQKLASMYDDEKRQRENFLYKFADYLPGELSLSLNILPIAYNIVELERINYKLNESDNSSTKSKEKEDKESNKDSKGNEEINNEQKDSKLPNVEINSPSNSSLDENSTTDAAFQSANESNASSIHSNS
ncbi:hypothetical protein K502DRAFT_323493 [Neoconidiobolus thromboides FSU 785]|nr:hypothetical protein K502DRAFT_323493 [Neoconidiobolus thromboides FSU 785]